MGSHKGIRVLLDEKITYDIFEKSKTKEEAYEQYRKRLERLRNEVPYRLKYASRGALLFSKYRFGLLCEWVPSVLTEVDGNGCNIIHYNPPIKKFSSDWHIKNYCRNLKTLINNGCDIDHQDHEGRTPLHKALISNNILKIKALLRNGPDVNIVDQYQKTVGAYSIEYKNWKEPIFNYILQCHAAGLYIHETNKDFLRIHQDTMWGPGAIAVDITEYLLENVYKELRELEKEMITDNISVRDVLTEKMVLMFPIMPKVKQIAICKFIESHNGDNQYKPCQWLPLLRLQIRRACKRRKLFIDTVNLCNQFLEPWLPNHCYESILIGLSNEELQNFNVAFKLKLKPEKSSYKRSFQPKEYITRFFSK